MRGWACAAAWSVCVMVLSAGSPAGAQVPASPPAVTAPAQAAPDGAGGDLSAQATDPTASLMALNFIFDAKASYWDLDDSGFEFRFQPVIPFKAWGTNNILRVVVPYQTGGPGDEGLKSVSIFDLVVVPTAWGRFGIGPVMSLAESTGAAPSKFAIGPALGGVGSVSKTLSIGLFTQNLFAAHVGITQLQPIITWQLGGGWALSSGDMQFTYDWKRGEWVLLPLGVQLGVVKAVAGQAFRFAINPQWNLADVSGTDKGKVVFTVTLLAPAK